MAFGCYANTLHNKINNNNNINSVIVVAIIITVIDHEHRHHYHQKSQTGSAAGLFNRYLTTHLHLYRG
jgi:hypothetical protein